MAILEVGLGGRLDATNCVPSPVVTGISSLGFDHMEILSSCSWGCSWQAGRQSVLLLLVHCKLLLLLQ